MEQNNLSINELLNRYPALASRLCTIFDYHYDAIQRELKAELYALPQNEQDIIRDSIEFYMEEDMLWPSNILEKFITTFK